MKLRDWMDNERHSSYTLAELFAKRGVKVTPQTIQSWCKGAIPRKQHRDEIHRLTGGAVQPASFLS